MIEEMIERMLIQRAKEFDDKVFGEIKSIATENGIDAIVTINEETVVKALKRSIPNKVIPFCNSGIALACPECGTFQDFVDKETLDNRSEYCYKCGQALDWSDTK